jgi:hypothetical protein
MRSESEDLGLPLASVRAKCTLIAQSQSHAAPRLVSQLSHTHGLSVLAHLRQHRYYTQHQHGAGCQALGSCSNLGAVIREEGVKASAHATSTAEIAATRSAAMKETFLRKKKREDPRTGTVNGGRESTLYAAYQPKLSIRTRPQRDQRASGSCPANTCNVTGSHNLCVFDGRPATFQPRSALAA